MSGDPIQSFAAVMAATGMKPPPAFIADGRMHVFNADGDGTLLDGWYVLRLEGFAIGAFGCKRKGLPLVWWPGAASVAAKGQRDRVLSSLRARLDAFSKAIARTIHSKDSELAQHYAVHLLRAAEGMVKLRGAVRRLDDPLALGEVNGAD